MFSNFQIIQITFCKIPSVQKYHVVLEGLNFEAEHGENKLKSSFHIQQNKNRGSF
jgi:hypothetical protein